MSPDYYCCPYCDEVNVTIQCTACKCPACIPIWFDRDVPTGNANNAGQG